MTTAYSRFYPSRLKGPRRESSGENNMFEGFFLLQALMCIFTGCGPDSTSPRDSSPNITKTIARGPKHIIEPRDQPVVRINNLSRSHTLEVRTAPEASLKGKVRLLYTIVDFGYLIN